MKEVIIAVLGMSGLGLFWALVLVICSKVFYVEENPLIEKILACLPGANCGACGFAGCGAYADAVAEEGADITLCPVNDDEGVECIAKLMGIEAGTRGPRLVAKLHCTGTKVNCEDRGGYEGLKTCTADTVTAGGSKACSYGCLGHGDCARVCLFNAIKMSPDGLPVVIEEKCTACGKCVEICPRDLFKLVPQDQKVFILCSSKDPGAIARKACKVACIGCGICVKQEETGVFTMENYLASVDYKKSKSADPEKLAAAAAKCPQKIISINVE
ncbi:RnfABCDGE type electron transport complex subunit B [Thermoproteota archaeon]